MYAFFYPFHIYIYGAIGAINQNIQKIQYGFLIFIWYNIYENYKNLSFIQNLMFRKFGNVLYNKKYMKIYIQYFVLKNASINSHDTIIIEDKLKT